MLMKRNKDYGFPRWKCSKNKSSIGLHKYAFILVLIWMRTKHNFSHKNLIKFIYSKPRARKPIHLCTLPLLLARAWNVFIINFAQPQIDLSTTKWNSDIPTQLIHLVTAEPETSIHPPRYRSLYLNWISSQSRAKPLINSPKFNHSK